MISRRDFLKQSTIATAGLSLPTWTLASANLASTKKVIKNTERLVGLQLYSLRDEMKRDPIATLSRVANMGYQHVENASYAERKFYGFSVKQYKQILKQLGLSVPSGHVWFQAKDWNKTKNSLTEQWKYAVEDAIELGQEYIVTFWLDKAIRQDHYAFRHLVELFNLCGEYCKQAGIKFCYHNHHFEFTDKHDGKSLFELIMDNTDPELVHQQLDIGNIYNANISALNVLEQYPGRFQSLHIKDMLPVTDQALKYESTVLGQGVINLKAAIDKAISLNDSRHLIIEIASYQDTTPLKSVELSLAQMRKWGYTN